MKELEQLNQQIPDVSDQLKIKVKKSLNNFPKKIVIKRIRAAFGYTVLTAFSLLLIFIMGITIYYNQAFFLPRSLFVEIAQNRVETAQYLPNLAVFSNEQLSMKMSTSYDPLRKDEFMDSIVGFEGLQELIDTTGYIDWGYNREWTVDEIKEQMRYITERVDKYDVWVNLYDGFGAYYISYDEINQVLDIYWSGGGGIPYVFEREGLNLIKHETFGGFPQKTINQADDMFRIRYYYDELGREVVETHIYKSIRYYDEIISASYQYLKNVKDTSFTKYRIYPVTDLDHETMYSAYDVTTSNPYGTTRDFMQINYNENEFVFWSVGQAFPSYYHAHPVTTNSYFVSHKKDQVYAETLLTGNHDEGEYDDSRMVRPDNVFDTMTSYPIVYTGRHMHGVVTTMYPNYKDFLDISLTKRNIAIVYADKNDKYLEGLIGPAGPQLFNQKSKIKAAMSNVVAEKYEIINEFIVANNFEFDFGSPLYYHETDNHFAFDQKQRELLHAISIYLVDKFIVESNQQIVNGNPFRQI